MQKTLYLKATVLPDGKIEIEDTGLKEDIIKEGPGQRLFKSAADVEEYLKSERASWDV